MLWSPVDLGIAWSTGLLAFSLAISGASKLGSSSTTIAAMRALRVPQFFRNIWVARVIPVGELFLACVILLGTGWIGSGGALAAATMLTIFTAFLLGVLRRHETVDCGCFGVLASDSRVSLWTVLRNLILIMSAFAVVFRGSGSPSLFVKIMRTDVENVLTLFLCWAVTAIIMLGATQVRMHKKLTICRANSSPFVSEQVEKVKYEMGSEIPEVELVSGGRRTSRLRDIGQGNPVLLVFVSAECSSCAQVAEQIPKWSKRLSPIIVGVATSSRPDIVDERLSQAIPQMYYGALAAKGALGITSVPAAVALGGSHQPVVASPIAYGIREIESLVKSLEASSRI